MSLALMMFDHSVVILNNEYPDVKFYLRFVLLQLMDLWERSAVQNTTDTMC
jgi:hypothetical protein